MRLARAAAIGAYIAHAIGVPEVQGAQPPHFGARGAAKASCVPAMPCARRALGHLAYGYFRRSIFPAVQYARAQGFLGIAVAQPPQTGETLLARRPYRQVLSFRLDRIAVSAQDGDKFVKVPALRDRRIYVLAYGGTPRFLPALPCQPFAV